MNVIVTDKGFGRDDWTDGFANPETANDVNAIDIGSDAEVDQITRQLGALKMIRIAFPSSADGRGFTLARRLRQAGFKGRLRAHGDVLADQYAMARRSGFDEVEIDAALAERQPQSDWLTRANWQHHNYQARLRG